MGQQLMVFDQIMTNKELINVKNGMLNWQTGELLKHDEEYFSTIQIPVKYNPSADSSRIADWLESTFGDTNIIQLVCELFGYCLIPDTSMKKAFLLVGSGANGKSVFINVLHEFLGVQNVSNISLQGLQQNQYARACLFGKLANLFTAMDDRWFRYDSYFEKIISGDMIDARIKHRGRFYFKPYAKLIFETNRYPKANGLKYWIIIPFSRTFAGRAENKNLFYELATEENFSALLNLAVDGLTRLQKNQKFTSINKK